MTATRRIGWAAGAVVATLATGVLASQAPTTQTLAASVRIPQAVSANGQPLAPGTYVLRLAADEVTPVVGQPVDSERWVEFVQGSDVKGKELATVVSAGDLKAVLKGAPPAPGTARVQTLAGRDYVRVWANHGGTSYIVHLAVKP